uniref:Uncharacterized protein n=1 Tax=Lygus hesperus TaxID=30085 RepID=A0A0K8TJM4_LYGHE
MGPLSLVRAALLLGLVGICYAEPKKLNEKQIDYFKKHAEEWGAPAVLKVLDGGMEKTKKAQKLKMTYEAEDNQICEVTLTKYPKGMSTHGWNCHSKPDPVEPEEDIEEDTEEEGEEKKEKDKKEEEKKEEEGTDEEDSEEKQEKKIKRRRRRKKPETEEEDFS